MDFLTKCKDVAAANYATLAKAGLFKLDNFKAFTMELSFPFVMFMENKSVAYVQSIVLARTMDLNVRVFSGSCSCTPLCSSLLLECSSSTHVERPPIFSRGAQFPPAATAPVPSRSPHRRKGSSA
jgi:hypothetical protein